jgi:hypothetical protein
MKSGKFFFIAILFAISTTVFASEPAAYHGGASFGVFYSQLNPYGSWMQMNDGLVVWRPHVAARWSPYTYGNWMWTDCGWYWNSDESFGDVVYHYGRWYDDDYYGWIWVPDYEWGPAWVDWRYDDNYIGWTPLPPYANFSMNDGISFSEGFSTGYSRWHFVEYDNFCNPQIGRYFAPARDKARFFDRTHTSHDYGYENNRVVNRNIPRDMFEARSQTRLSENRINFRETEGMGRSQVRGNERRIDVAIPRANSNRVDVNTLSINRADRASTLKGDRVQMGERVRNNGTTPQTGKNNSTIQRNNQNNGQRSNNATIQRNNQNNGQRSNNATIQRNNQNNGQRQGIKNTTINPGNNRNNNSTVNPNRNNNNSNRNKNSEIRQGQSRQNTERNNRDAKSSERKDTRESQRQGREENNRESQSRTR